MATEKQVGFIGRLMDEREIGDLSDSVEAQSYHAGQGFELSGRQASQFIGWLLECPTVCEAAGIKPGVEVGSPKYGKGIVKTITARTAFVEFTPEFGTRQMSAGFLEVL